MPGTMVMARWFRWSNIGGQPFELTTWTTDAQIKEAVEFVKWWLSPDIQHQFAAMAASRRSSRSMRSEICRLPSVEPRLGASTRLAEGRLARSASFRAPDPAEDQFDLAITVKQDAKTTLDNIAKFQQDLLTQAGLIQGSDRLEGRRDPSCAPFSPPLFFPHT